MNASAEADCRQKGQDITSCLLSNLSCYCPCGADKNCFMQRDATTLEVTELPIRKWTQDYKEFLETLIKPEDKNATALIEVTSVLAYMSLLCLGNVACLTI